MKQPQLWFCQGCKALGVVMFSKHAGVWEVSNDIEDAHRDESPNCTTNTQVICVENLRKTQIISHGVEVHA